MATTTNPQIELWRKYWYAHWLQYGWPQAGSVWIEIASYRMSLN